LRFCGILLYCFSGRFLPCESPSFQKTADLHKRIRAYQLIIS
jgi:hypothetical protein